MQLINFDKIEVRCGDSIPNYLLQKDSLQWA